MEVTNLQNLDLTNWVLAGWLVIVIIRRQLAPRVIRFKANFFILIMLMGIASIGDALTKQQVTITSSQAVIFGCLSLISAVGFALLRAWSYHFWVNDAGLVMRQGNWLTLLWWALSLAGHLAVDQLWTGSSVTLLLYVGVTLGVQRGWVWWLARRTYPAALKANQQLQTERHQRRHSCDD